jgi:hypothetical protein
LAEPRRRVRKKAGRPSNQELQNQRLLELAREKVKSFDNKMFGEMYLWAVEKAIDGDKSFLNFIAEFEEPPVDIETFIESPDIMGSTDLALWPEVRRAIIDINKYWWKGPQHAYTEALLCGATGTGKSELAKVTQAYHLHIMGCMKNPQAVYKLPQATSIVVVIQSAKPHVTKKILYMPLRKYIEAMPWFQKNMRPNKMIESEMYFERKNIRVVPGGSDADAILGEAIIGGILDEVNFMNVVQKSKRAEASTGRSGVYDQAQNIYDALTRRRKGRFMYPGQQVGCILVSSSTRYVGDFTDKRLKAIEKNGEHVYVYNKAQYEARPADRYCGETFQVAVENDAANDIRIISPEDRVSHRAGIIEVPIEYWEDFVKDAPGAMRDIVGKSANSINPFFRRRDKIATAVAIGKERGLESFLVRDAVILEFDGMPVVHRGHYCQNPSKPRYVHIDLSNTGDSCGIGMVRFDGLVEMARKTGEVEYLPQCTVEMAVSIRPSHNQEIDIGEIRSWVKQLKSLFGYPIRAVTYDSWNSLESRQQWAKQGMRTGAVSVDKTSAPYKTFRDALYDGRVALPENEILTQELYDLEFDEQKDKIDHPPNGSKDVADAVCGAFFCMSQRSQTWTIDPNAMTDFRADPGYRFDEERPV